MDTPLLRPAPQGSDRPLRTGAEWLLLALLPFLLVWKWFMLDWFHIFMDSTLRAKTLWAMATCFLQDLLLWSAVFLLLRRAARARRWPSTALVVVIVNLVAAIYLIDVRVRVISYHQITWDAVVAALEPGSGMRSTLPTFLGGTFYKLAIASLIALDLSMLVPLGARLGRRLRPLFHEGRPANATIAAPALVLLVVAVASRPQPYHAETSVFTASLFALLRAPWREAPPAHAACEEKPQPARAVAAASPLSGAASRRNVVLIVGETWGYWESSFGDPASDRTPSLRALGRVGPITAKAYAQTGYSTKAIYGILTGRYASPKLEIVESSAPSIDSLAKTLGKAGYHTSFISAQSLAWERTREQYVAMGFDQVWDSDDLKRSARAAGRQPKLGSWGVLDDELTQGVIDALPRDRPFFLALYTASTHHPYECPGGGLEGPANGQRRFRCALQRADRVLGELVDQLERRGDLRNTIIAVVGDHGENFEGGRFKPRGCPMTEVELAVPLVIAAPGLAGAHVEVPFARQVDVVPTLIDLLGVASDTPVQGRSLLAGGEGPPAFINGHGSCDVGGVIEGEYKRVVDFDTGEAWSRRLAPRPEESGWTPLAPNERARLEERVRACGADDDAYIRGK